MTISLYRWSRRWTPLVDQRRRDPSDVRVEGRARQGSQSLVDRLARCRVGGRRPVGDERSSITRIAWLSPASERMAWLSASARDR